MRSVLLQTHKGHEEHADKDKHHQRELETRG